MPERTSRRRTAAAAEAPALIAQCMPGLERLLTQQVRALDPAVRVAPSQVLAGRDAVAGFDGVDAVTLMRARIAEDVFAVVATGPIAATTDAVQRIARSCAASPRWPEALAEHDRHRGGRGLRTATTLRVIVRSGHDHHFRRVDLERAAGPAICARLGRHWRVVDDRAHLEVWVTLFDRTFVAAVRLTTAEQRRRSKVAHFPGSLRPSVAAALVLVSAPRDDDVVLDPFCGAGTILIERDAAGPHGLLIGGDIDAAAIDAARRNIGPRHQPLELHSWDATRLPLDAGSVDAVITNPPFGIKVGGAAAAAALVPRFLGEAARVVRPGGRLVVLSADPGPLTATLQDGPWAATRRVPFTLQGRPATIVAAIHT